MFKQIGALILAIGLSLNAFAAEKSNATLKKVSQKYRTTKLVEMKVEKIDKLVLQGRENKFEGTLAISSGKIRWENTTPEKSLLVFDGTTIWSIQYPPKEFGGDPQIARGKVNKKNKSQTIIATLLGGDLQGNFKVTDEKTDGDQSTLSIVPLKDDLSIKDIKLVVNTKKVVVDQISYQDDVQNVTTMKFSDVKFKSSVKKSLFKYEPPKGVPVTDL
ncbi:LolA family protein [Bdellovibrio sp. HCB290]|uniref:LolA family protein n=1 Tax=Bdellovibrio sp. HCB290 TaxID=3394356 RepID=UPI0039B5CC5D